MNLCMIGTGYVGLVSGVCFSDLGNQVICVDKDLTKINKLQSGIIPIYEPGLEEILKRNYKVLISGFGVGYSWSTTIINVSSKLLNSIR